MSDYADENIIAAVPGARETWLREARLLLSTSMPLEELLSKHRELDKLGARWPRPQTGWSFVESLKVMSMVSDPRVDEWRELTTELEQREKQLSSVGIEEAKPTADVAKGFDGLGQKETSQLDSEPDIVKRRAIVKQNIDSQNWGLCVLFDTSNIPLPRSMKESGSWGRAYKSKTHRHAIESLISRDREIVRG
jgi:hypothetical protein